MIQRNIAIIILYDSDKKILLQHRDKDAKRLPDYWAFFGGGLENDETPEEAMRREALEELNYVVKKPRLVMKQQFKGKRHEGTKYIYVEKCDNKEMLKLQEGQNWGWFTIPKTKNLKIVDHDREVLDYIADKL